MSKTLLILLGPTGVGKTDLSLSIARHFRTEILSCDSRQIYREMTIGTAVPSQEALAGIPHHFIQTHSIHEPINASQFEALALEKLDNLFAHHEVVIMTGGSMLYIDALCHGLDELPTIAPELRHHLMQRAEQEGLETLIDELAHLDPVYHRDVDLKNRKRILHALEICLTTGHPYSTLRTNTRRQRPFNIIKIGLNGDREWLYERINLRVDQMMQQGLEQEAHSLLPFRHLNGLNTVGYRELFDYFDGSTDRDQAVERIKANSRKYARKQLTWFRRDEEITWFHPTEQTEIFAFLNDMKVG